VVRKRGEKREEEIMTNSRKSVKAPLRLRRKGGTGHTEKYKINNDKPKIATQSVPGALER
jgi:hypothetical protein